MLSLLLLASLSLRDGNGRADPLFLTYDELGKLTKVTQPSPAPGKPQPVTQYAYDPNRNLHLQTDADGRLTEMTYDELNRLVSTTRDPGGLNLTTTVTRFDANGNPEEVRDGKGQVSTMTYDELNRMKTKAHALAPGAQATWWYTGLETYTYDPNNNLKTSEEEDFRSSGTDPPIRLTTREWDDLDRLKSETTTQTDGTTRKVAYDYYRNGLKKSVTDPSSGTTLYAYDGRNRLKVATTSAGDTGYEYYPDSLLKSVTYPGTNGARTGYGYDKADRLLNLTSARSGQPLTAYAYTYDDNGNRLTQDETNGSVTAERTSYTYDNLDRVGTVTYPSDAANANGRKVTYGYDGAGNRASEVTTDPVTQQVLALKTGHFDRANRLKELTDNVDPSQTTVLTWDNNSNMTTQTVGGVRTEYRYDLRDKLVEAERAGHPLARFAYDFEGRRILKVGDPVTPGGSGVQSFVYDGTSQLAEYDEAGQQTARYEWGSDRLISLFRSGSGTRQYYHLDGLQSVTALSDDAGGVTARYHLNAWGELKDPGEVQASGNRFLFTEHYFDTETDLYYAKARYLDPKLGRFITQDTFAPKLDEPPSLNLFAYAYANPLRYIDLTGHAPEESLAEYARKHGRGEFSGLPKPTPLGPASDANGKRLPSWEEIVAECKADPDHCRATPKNTPEGEVKEAGTVDKIIEAAVETRRKFRKYGEDVGEAATKDLIQPKERETAEHERAQRSALDYDPHVNIAEGADEVVTDVGREGGGQLGEQAFDAAAAKGMSMAAGGVLRVAGKGKAALETLAKSSDEVIEAAEAEAKGASKAEQRLIGTQNPETAWAAKTGRAYDRRVSRFWRQYEGKTVSGWRVESVNRRLATGVQPDLVLVNEETKTIVIHDVTSKASSGHLAKGAGYQKFFEAQRPGYTVRYSEGYWEGLENSWEALNRKGDLYFPGQTKP